MFIEMYPYCCYFPFGGIFGCSFMRGLVNNQKIVYRLRSRQSKIFFFPLALILTRQMVLDKLQIRFKLKFCHLQNGDDSSLY